MKRKKNWKLIGRDSIGMEWKARAEPEKFVVFIHFYMTDEGERRAQIMSDDVRVVRYVETATTEWNEALSWASGGPFPKDFKPLPDTLGPMLSKLVQDRMMGGEK